MTCALQLQLCPMCRHLIELRDVALATPGPSGDDTVAPPPASADVGVHDDDVATEQAITS